MWNGWSDDGGAKTGKQEQTINKLINMKYETRCTIITTCTNYKEVHNEMNVLIINGLV